MDNKYFNIINLNMDMFSNDEFIGNSISMKDIVDINLNFNNNKGVLSITFDKENKTTKTFSIKDINGLFYLTTVLKRIDFNNLNELTINVLMTKESETSTFIKNIDSEWNKLTSTSNYKESNNIFNELDFLKDVLVLRESYEIYDYSDMVKLGDHINRTITCKPLTPIGGDDDEWVLMTLNDNIKNKYVYYNKHYPSLRKIVLDSDNDKRTFYEDLHSSKSIVSFPYYPPTMDD